MGRDIKVKALNDISTEAIGEIMDVSRRAGEAILEVYASSFAVDRKDDRSPLTEADRRSHDILCDYFQERFAYPVLSEEGRDIPYVERKQWDHFWLLDPLDGTKEFIKRNGEFTVNIALIYQSKPVLGFIYIPVQDVIYYAASGLGSYKINGAGEERLAVRSGGECPIVVGSRSHGTPQLEKFVKGLREKYGSVDFVSAGSSLKFCLVAEGKADVYPRLAPTMEWDTAAGQIIVEEAGGQVLDFSTQEQLAYNKESLLNPHFIAGAADFSRPGPAG